MGLSICRDVRRLRQSGWFIATISLPAIFGLGLPLTASAQETAPAETRDLETQLKTFTGDFDGMVERRVARVAVPYSRSLFYHDRGRERGLTADIVRKFEEYVNKKHKKDLDKRPITIVLVPTTRDQLIPSLLDGRADIAAGNITITDLRQTKVDFSEPVS